MLIIFGGLPGVGKTTVAKVLAKQLKAVYLRVDTVEQVLKREATLEGPEGYMVCWAQALENLKLGMTVVADSVNSIQVTREAWQNVAKDASVTFLEVELVCSDYREHQRRIETRKADIIGHQLPTWDNVQQRQYERWCPHLVIDTAKQTVDKIVEEILERIKADTLSKAIIEDRKIFLISGPPGAGKSTLAKAIAQHFNKSIHIECDSLYNMVQGGHKQPWEDGADALASLMYKVLVSQAVIYLQAGFAVISDYVWSPEELYSLCNKIGHYALFHPIFLLPKKSVNLERDLNREYMVGSERVVKYWDDFEKWRSKFPKIFFDNSNVSAVEMSKNLIEENGFNHTELKQFFNL